MAVCQSLSRSIHEITSQLQGLSCTNSYRPGPEPDVLRQALYEPIVVVLAALQAICADLAKAVARPDHSRRSWRRTPPFA